MYFNRDKTEWLAFVDMLERAFYQGQQEEILELLLTPDEREAIGLRLQIVAKLLERKEPQRVIQANLNTSAATITRGSNMIKSMSPSFLMWIQQQFKEQKTK